MLVRGERASDGGAYVWDDRRIEAPFYIRPDQVAALARDGGLTAAGRSYIEDRITAFLAAEQRRSRIERARSLVYEEVERRLGTVDLGTATRAEVEAAVFG